MNCFDQRLNLLRRAEKELLERKNRPVEGNGVYERYEFPVLTAAHAPLEWRYDLDPETNPYLMERFGINAVLNSGAIKWGDKYVLVARVEAADRKSSSPWPRAQTAWTISASGSIPSPCPNGASPPPTSMTCA